MPRRTPGRSLRSERNLAERIRMERERLGWTMESTAAHLAEVGCPIQKTAIHKIERAGRQVTVDELVAFSQVFDVPIDNLLLGPAGAPDARFTALLTAYEKAMTEAVRAAAAADAAARDLWDAARDAEGDAYFRRLERLEADGLLHNPYDAEALEAARPYNDALVPPWERPGFTEAEEEG